MTPREIFFEAFSPKSVPVRADLPVSAAAARAIFIGADRAQESVMNAVAKVSQNTLYIFLSGDLVFYLSVIVR